jgi:alpha-ketoglutarate-dependent 2,4-dichlorophenoxyacetate dioxygenase
MHPGCHAAAAPIDNVLLERTAAMALTITQIHPVFVGEVSGVDLTKPISRGDAAAIEEGMDQYGVLVFRDQKTTDEQQIAFTRNFGDLENYKTPGNVRKAEDNRLSPGIGDLSNLTKDGKVISADDRVWFFKLGDRLWHSDSSYRAIPAKYSLLSARVIPSWGANTEFADMRAAYDALDARTKAEVEDLICEHSLIYSREAIGFTSLTPEEIAAFRPVRQRLVRTHEATGRKSLFLSSHAGAILGWTVPEARSFLRDLTEHATQRQFVYSHSWSQYDLVMWDNRATMHRARRFDRNEVRDMRRTTLAGSGPTVEQASAA